MATKERSMRAAADAAMETGKPYVFYQVNNGQWMMASKQWYDNHPRRDAKNLTVIYPKENNGR